MCNFGRVHHEEQFCKIIFEFGSVVQEMSSKDISYLELWSPFVRGSITIFTILVVHHEDPFCENNFEFGPAVQEEILFKDISYLELWQPFCSAERNHLCNLRWRVL